jgi:serpin B
MVNDPNGIMIADSLWGSEYFAPPFREIARQYYRVELKKTQPSWVLSQQVSRWAMEKTGAQVPLSLGGLAKNDFLLVDVTRFHSFWLDNFEISKTKPTLFALLTGQQKPVPMMYRQADFNYLDGPRFQAIKLRYRENFVFYVFLPSKDSNLKKLEQTITADSWRDLLKQFRSRDGLLGLPKFKVETGYDVRAALESLGLKHIFESFGALRPAVSVPEGARLNNAFQKTTLSIDEKGTEAISVGFGGGVIGGVEGGIIGVERPKPFIMIIDRPFLFAIQDVRTGALLFLGTIVEP